MLIANHKGGYSFLKGIAPYSAGVTALAGFEIEHATFSRPVALRAGFEAVERHLERIGRPKQALCAMELRSPKPFSFQGFNDFNAGYVEVLKRWDIPVNGLNPIARTNVAPEVAPPGEPSLYAFSYTTPAREAPPSFVVAGAGELPEGSLDPHDVVRRGETSPEALVEKTRFVMGLMSGRLQGLGASWAQATATEVYTVHNLHALIAKQVLEPMGAGAAHGVRWHFARPPIVSIEYEMDVRGVRREIVLPG